MRAATALSLLLHVAAAATLLTARPFAGEGGDATAMTVELVPPAPAPPPDTVSEAAAEAAAVPVSVTAPAPVPARSQRAAAPVARPAIAAAPAQEPPVEPMAPEPGGQPAVPAVTASPPVAVPGHGPSAEDERRAYAEAVWRRILAGKPDRARFPGTVMVRFAIAADGSLAVTEVAEPSGVPALDSLAVAVVERAAPFPPPPARGPVPAPFTLPVRFR